MFNSSMDRRNWRTTTLKTMDVLFVKIYVTESSKLLKIIMNYLKNDAGIRGVSVFRAISGFGESGEHTASLIDLSLDLPLCIEFFDSKEKVENSLDYLSKIIKHEHIIYWEAKANK